MLYVWFLLCGISLCLSLSPPPPPTHTHPSLPHSLPSSRSLARARSLYTYLCTYARQDSTELDVYTCIQIHICIYIHTHTYIHTYTYMYLYTHTHTYIYIYVCIHTQTHTHTHAHTELEAMQTVVNAPCDFVCMYELNH